MTKGRRRKMNYKQLYKRRTGPAIDKLSDRARRWGSLLVNHSLDYPIIEAQHSAIDRLLNREIPDGEKALELVYESLASEGAPYRDIMEDSLAINDPKAVGILEKCSKKSLYNDIKKTARDVLRKYKSRQLRLEKNKALDGNDDQVKAKLDVLVIKLSRHMRD